MSPHDMTKYRVAFDEAATSLGWRKEEVEIPHERDDDRSRMSTVWIKGDKWVIEEDDLSETLVVEIIRIAARINVEDLIFMVEEHHKNFPNHGLYCACLDTYIRQVENILKTASNQEVRLRVEYVLRKAMQ